MGDLPFGDMWRAEFETFTYNETDGEIISLVTNTPQDEDASVLLNTHRPESLHYNETINAEYSPKCYIYDFTIEAMAMGFFCAFGFVGNILSMICLWKDKSKTATPFLLVSLEIADTLFLITVLILRVFVTIAQYTQSPTLQPIFPYLAKYVFPIALVCETGTIYLTILVTVNRYISVCLPYQASDLCSIRNAQKHVVLVWLFSWIYNIPRFLQYEIIETTDPDTNMTYKKAEETAMARSKVYQILYSNILYSIVMFLVPLITLCILNSKLIAALKRTKTKRKQLLTHSEHSSRSEDDITLILIVVVLVFVIFQTPALITQLLVVFLPEAAKHCPKAFFFYERISDLFVVGNSSINFLIYCFCSRRFRQILIKTVCKIGRNGNNSPENSMPNGNTHINKTPAHTRYSTLARNIPQENTQV